jgi:predicted dehydrogenase
LRPDGGPAQWSGRRPNRERAFEQRLLLRPLRRVVAALELVDPESAATTIRLAPGAPSARCRFRAEAVKNAVASSSSGEGPVAMRGRRVQLHVRVRLRRHRSDRAIALLRGSQELADLGDREINGSKGSIAFDLERINELQVDLAGSEPGRRAQGFRTVLVTAPEHPFIEHWWPEGHVPGWEHTFVHELHHFLTAIRDDADVGPHGATFEDGYRAAEVCDAMLRSAESGQREAVNSR